MKRYIFFLPLVFCFFSFKTLAADNSDLIVGVWKSNSEGLMVKIDKVGDHFQGRIVWIESENGDELVFDVNNPDERLTNLPLKGNRIIQELLFNPKESAWDGGTFYSYKDGKIYHCRILLNNENQIRILKSAKENQVTEAEIWIRQ